MRRSLLSELPEIAVVIPTYGRPDSLAASINTVLQQSCENWELLIIDDNPSDSEHRASTCKLVENFSDPRIRYIPLADNCGACVARNRGVDESRAEVVAFLDDDDIWHKDKLATCLECFKRDTELGLLIHHIKQIYRGSVTHFEFNLDGDFHEYFLKAAMGVSCSAIVVRKTLFKKAEGFDPEQESYQDLDLMLRMSAQSKAEVLPQYLLEYQLSDYGITFNFTRKASGAKRIIKKHYANSKSSSGVIGAAKLHIALGDYYMMLGDSKAAASAYRAALAVQAIDKKSRIKLMMARLHLAPLFQLLLNWKKRLA